MSAAAIRVFSSLRSGLRTVAPRLPSPALRSAYISRPAFRDCRRAFSQSSLWQAKKYTEEHEWIEVAGDGKTATIGITEYAANALGDVVFVELPAVDTDVAAGETIGAVESVKSASDILCPVTGKIVEANTKLEESPKVINESPEEKGWFAKIELADPTELEGLMEKEVYLAKVEEADVES
ncbi:glycine cleavage system H protein [Histoplasma capsulatum G186AR]|uniref:Glycine cleavage system H protein n=2 Tax=Ajellomyces capsulatus TaxID=5037 RepID=C0NJ41_AJECG|nr:glycine cleavage system H protein [Histoplasma capsulatum G186AR]EEH07882.1 glycine cleavage system H protein [Histoplasma capsulatum G186AR]KAG5299784.1 glycine cleavage system H protein [Histoplasma capsulatum]QSS67589.1 glycine cleavage system H protein [Histoplasma capsulatum G186AR]